MTDLFSSLQKTLLKSDDNKTLTENGAIAYKSIGDKLVDLDASVMSLRNATAEEVMDKFHAVYSENPENAIIWMFMIGDIREGKGERDTFNRCMDFLVKHHAKVVGSLLPLIPEYTRWDYATRLMLSDDDYVSKKAEDFVIEQLREDLTAVEEGKNPSLLAKWLPSIQTKKAGQRRIVFKIEKRMGFDHKSYRKAISQLRGHLNIIEKSLSTKDISNINMEALTSRQNLKYGPVLQKIDPVARMEYLQKVMTGEARMNAGVVYPYEILHRYCPGWHVNSYDMDLEALWKMLPRAGAGDTLVIRDGSGSMNRRISEKSNATCLDVATSFAIYFSEQLDGPLNDKFITFSSRPQIVDMSHLTTLQEKINLCNRYDDYTNTDIKKTFDLLLETLVAGNAKPEEIPRNILILSDMEFDYCFSTDEVSAVEGDCSCWNKSVFEHIQEEFKKHGYELPRMIFWNINANRVVQPLIDNERGLVILSGFSTDTYNMVVKGEFDKDIIVVETGEKKVVTMTPEEQMAKRLSAPRYDAVRKAIEPIFNSETMHDSLVRDISKGTET